LKHYRPHILVVIALAVVLSSGWHDVFRNGLADQSFNWLHRLGGEIVVVDRRHVEGDQLRLVIVLAGMQHVEVGTPVNAVNDGLAIDNEPRPPVAERGFADPRETLRLS
jgi:hypothetical protein